MYAIFNGRTVSTGTVLALGAGLVFTGVAAFAGPLEPSGPPASSSVTLNQLDASMRQIDKSTASLMKRVASSTVPSGQAIPDDPGAVDPSQGTQALSVVMSFEMDNGLPPITGGVVTAGHEGAVSVLSFSHEIKQPRDAASGLPTGRRQHSPFVFTKVYDKASPVLAKTCAQGQHIKSATITVRKSSEGDTNGEPYYTITLEDCIITGFSTGFPNLEQVELVYQKITWTWMDGGITAEDTWSATPDAK